MDKEQNIYVTWKNIEDIDAKEYIGIRAATVEEKAADALALNDRGEVEEPLIEGENLQGLNYDQLVSAIMEKINNLNLSSESLELIEEDVRLMCEAL